VYPPPGVPPVATPIPYSRYGDEAVTCVADKPVMLANDADVPQESDDAINRTSFVDAKPAPDMSRVQSTVRMHCVAPVSAPFIVNAPTMYEKSAKPDGLCDQQTEYRSLPAVPAVAVLSGNTLYGSVVAVVVFGFVSPDRDASTSAPHESEDRITRTAFVAADPLVVHASCRLQLTVNVHA
jgi:hypothetical protein